MIRFSELLWDPRTLGPLLLSAKVLLVAVPLLLLAGVGLGYLLGRQGTPLRGLLELVAMLPLVFPPVAIGFGLIVLLGRRSPLGQLLEGLFGTGLVFSFPGLVLAAVVAGLPLMVRPVQAAVQSQARRLMELSAVLGKGEAETFVRVVLPSIRRSILAGLVLSAGRALGEVGISLMLGGNILGRTNTLSLEVYNAVSLGEYERAGVLAAVLGVTATLLFLLFQRLSER